MAEGIRTVEELLRSNIASKGFLISSQLGTTARGIALRERIVRGDADVAELSEKDFESAALTDTPQGVLAIATIPSFTPSEIEFPQQARCVILDGLQDPGNTGTIVRTAAALGASLVVAAPGTVDLWNAKVVRSAMGANFHITIGAAEWADIAAFKLRSQSTVWGADAAGTPVKALDMPNRLTLVMGNEGRGLSPEARELCDGFVSLPIGNAVESLNVAVATGILLYQLRS